MSEDNSFNSGQKKEEERKLAPDFFGSLGKGTLDKENIGILKNSSGLTPFSFSPDHRDRIMNSASVDEGFPTLECTENAELVKNSSGLEPIRLSGDDGDLKTKVFIRIKPQIRPSRTPQPQGFRVRRVEKQQEPCMDEQTDNGFVPEKAPGNINVQRRLFRNFLRPGLAGKDTKGGN